MLTFPNGILIAKESDFAEMIKHDKTIEHSGCRLCFDTFGYRNSDSKEDFLNYSTDPNCLYHCGILFAIKEIKIGEELTIDYDNILPTNHQLVLGDKTIIGLNGVNSFEKSSKILIDVFRNR